MNSPSEREKNGAMFLKLLYVHLSLPFFLKYTFYWQWLVGRIRKEFKIKTGTRISINEYTNKVQREMRICRGFSSSFFLADVTTLLARVRVSHKRDNGQRLSSRQRHILPPRGIPTRHPNKVKNIVIIIKIHDRQSLSSLKKTSQWNRQTL